MINPSDVIQYDRTVPQLEEFWLFCTVVAGKTATTQARLLDNLLNGLEGATPFAKLRGAIARGDLSDHLKRSRIGQYNRLEKCFVQSLGLDLRADPLAAFEAVHGVGPKTARMFLMHSRPQQRLAAIDTHVLKHLRAQGIAAPEVTPSGVREYRRLELAFLALADAAGQDPSEYDLAVWRSYARHPALAA